MHDPILAAIAFASRDEHAGAGFTLDIHLSSGEVLVDVGVVDHGSVRTHSSGDVTGKYRLIGDGDGADMFVNPALVSRVVVKW